MRWDSEKLTKLGYRKTIGILFGFLIILFFVLLGTTAETSKPREQVQQQITPDEVQRKIEESKIIEQQQIEQTKEPTTEENPFVQKQKTRPVPTSLVPTPTTTLQTTPIQPSQEATSKVVYVVDGDTIEIESSKRVRLIGINTPESGQPYFSEARNKLIELVLNKNVRLEKDVTDTDKYGRLLRYIYTGDLFVNLEMVRLGYANSYTYPPDVKYQDQLLTAEKEARSQQLGLWKPAKTTESTQITLITMHADAAGNDNQNLNDEYFALKNNNSTAIDMAGWTVKDAGTHIFTFPSFTLNSGTTVTIYTGSGNNTNDKLYWGNNGAVWNNDGDTLYLRNTNGDLVLEYSY